MQYQWVLHWLSVRLLSSSRHMVSQPLLVMAVPTSGHGKLSSLVYIHHFHTTFQYGRMRILELQTI
jgi:hypothetical protein